jgi:hypothetical protein
MIVERAVKLAFSLTLAIGLVAMPNALLAFEECDHCDECKDSLHYGWCQDLTGCEGDWCNYAGPSACNCQSN